MEDYVSTLSFDLIVTDPPYGISHPTNYKSRGRQKLAQCKDYPPVYQDDRLFDPTHLLALNKPMVLWGANHYANKLPNSGGWLVWDKKRPDMLDQATCELAWTNYVKGVRRFVWLWHGMMRQGPRIQLVHPTQKPVELTQWVLSLRWTPKEGILLDPYMGSGSTLIGAYKEGRKSIGIEVSEEYCEIAANYFRRL